MGRGRTRLDFDRALERSEGFLASSQQLQRMAEVGMRFGVVRLESDGLVITGKGCLELAL